MGYRGPFGAWLDSAIQGKKLSGNEVARRIGISPTLISNYRLGLSTPSGPTLAKLAAFFGRPIEDLRELLPRVSDDDPDVVDVWEVEAEVLAAGLPNGDAVYAGTYRLQSPAERDHAFVVCRVSGDCLAPKIEPGDRVVIDLSRAQSWGPGDIVAAFANGDLLVKRAERVFDGEVSRVVLSSHDGTRHVPDGTVHVVGVVVEIRKRV